MNQAFAGTQNAPTPREPTINERLNSVSSRMQSQCERIERVLARVNGTPQGEGVGHADKVATISSTLPLSVVVDHLEAVQSRLVELASGVERIA